MKNKTPQAVIDWVANFSKSKTRYEISLLGEFNRKTVYLVHEVGTDWDNGGASGLPTVLLYDGSTCKVAIDPFKILDYFD